MLQRRYLGLRIAPQGLQAVALRRRGKPCFLCAARGFTFSSEVLAPSLRELNVKQPEKFVDALREVVAPLAGREDRIALSLPDSCGHIILTELDSPYKTQEEGRDILRWQLKKNLPGEWNDIHLDFQVLRRDDSGRQQVLVALIDRAVLEQYEELTIQAGFHASQVGFHSLDLYDYYRPRLDMGGDFTLIGLEGRTLSVEIFQDAVPVFHRVRSIVEEAEQVFQELNRSLAGARSISSVALRGAVFLHTDWTDTDALKQVLTALFEQKPQMLNPHLSRMVLPEHQTQAPGETKLVAAIGAAERMM